MILNYYMMCYSLKKSNYCHFHVSQQHHLSPLIQLECLPVLYATALLDMSQICCLLKMEIIQVKYFILLASFAHQSYYLWAKTMSSSCLSLVSVPPVATPTSHRPSSSMGHISATPQMSNEHSFRPTFRLGKTGTGPIPCSGKIL